MGQQQMTLSMHGQLTLSIDGSPTRRPLDVAIDGLELDLAYLMQSGGLTIDPNKPGKVRLSLDGVTIGFTMDAEDVLSRATDAIVSDLEEHA